MYLVFAVRRKACHHEIWVAAPLRYTRARISRFTCRAGISLRFARAYAVCLTLHFCRLIYRPPTYSYFLLDGYRKRTKQPRG